MTDTRKSSWCPCILETKTQPPSQDSLMEGQKAHRFRGCGSRGAAGRRAPLLAGSRPKQRAAWSPRSGESTGDEGRQRSLVMDVQPVYKATEKGGHGRNGWESAVCGCVINDPRTRLCYLTVSEGSEPGSRLASGFWSKISQEGVLRMPAGLWTRKA